MASAWLMLAVCGCGFTTGSSTEVPTNVSVSVSPQSASVLLGQTVQFMATVTGVSSNAVNWSVNNVAGGNSTVGTISASGLYAAPRAMPSASNVTATAQSAPQASGSATVQIQSGIVVSIAPNSASLGPGGTANFTATVSGAGTGSSGVSWSVNNVSGGNATVGTLSVTGPDAATYTAPAVPPAPSSVSVVATSVADPSETAVASVTISCGAANSIAPASVSVDAGATLNFTASLCVAPGTAMAWSVNGIAGGNSTVGTVTTIGANAATYTAPTTAPTANPMTVEAAAGPQTASAVVTVVGNAPIAVSVTPALATVAVGQSARFTATVTGTSNVNVTWTVNGVANGNSVVGEVCAPGSNPCAAPSGAETTVDYVAPQTQPQPSSGTLTATNQADPASSGSAQIAISAPAQPGVNVAPFYAFLAASQQFQFIVNVTGVASAGVTWTISSAVPGQGCSGASCGSIDNAGNYTAPGAAPSPNAISITATSVANPSLAGMATVAITSGPTIETVLPSSVIAGAQQSFQLAVEGLNFVATTGNGTSQLFVNNSPRTTNCPTANLCTITLQPSDVASAGALSIELQNSGTPATLSNPVSVVILPAPQPPSTISLTSAASTAQSNDIIVVEPTTAGATTSPVNVDFVGLVSPDGSTCTIQASAITVTRPASGTTMVNICVQGNFLDPTFSYAFSAPQTGGDIGISTASMDNLFPNLIELTLTISSQTAAGLRTLFVTTPNGDVATATGVLEVQ
ncbi:MAG: hypothetical protein WBE86_06890 [Candidatus Acidiferrales bacterium]